MFKTHHSDGKGSKKVVRLHYIRYYLGKKDGLANISDLVSP